MHPALLDPSLASETAPAQYAVQLLTTKGSIVIDVTRAKAPRGADRFYNLVKIGYYDEVCFFRVIPGFMAQAGIHGNPAVSKVWKNARFPDDVVSGSNAPGAVSFATSGKDSRTMQFFINLADNKRLDAMGFAPFGQVRDMEIALALHSGYGESMPHGAGPMQGRLQREGNVYLRNEFPKLDSIHQATLL
jgi:peptidyl-prolyl cis-trans isomerase A (cyclophilin A)